MVEDRGPGQGRRFVVVELRDARHIGPLAGPLARVCGLSALDRTLSLLERAGYSGAVLLACPEDVEPIRAALSRARASGLALIFKSGPAGPAAGVRPEAPLSLWPALEVLTALEEPPPEQILYWPAAVTFGRRVPALVRAEAPRGGALAGPAPAPALIHLGAVQAHAELGADELITTLEQEGRLERVELEHDPVRLLSVEDTHHAEARLLDSLRKPEDGVVARFDRYVSLGVSRWLMRLPVTPNAATAAAALVGLACGLLAAQGGYWMMLLGALLFQLNSILDGVDGEIARAKLLESKTGQWLDTISDDFSNVAFVVGAGVGCARTWDTSLYLVLGGVAAVGFVINSAIMYHYLITVARSGDLNAYRKPWETHSRVEQGHDPAPAPQGTAARIFARIEPVVRRDFFVLLTTVVALVGQLRLMLWLYAAGATAVWVSIVLYHLLGPRRGRGGEGGA